MLLLPLTSSSMYAPHIPAIIIVTVNVAFHQEYMSNGFVATDHRWQIGMHGGITQHHVKVIGAIHVSAGTWMPILQIDGYVV